MRLWPRNAVAEQLKITNLYLALIAEVLQKEPPPPPRTQLLAKSPTKQSVMKVDFPPAFVDAMELLARRLWIDLPEGSKEDLTP